MTRAQHAFSNSLLLLSKEMDHSPSVAQIAERAGYQRQTFYNHFQNVEELLRWTYEELALNHFSTIHSLTHWEEEVVIGLNALMTHRVFILWSIEQYPNVLRQQLSMLMTDLMSDLLSALQSCSSLPSLDQQLFQAQFFAHGCVGTLFDWIESNFYYDAEQLASALHELVRQLYEISFERYTSKSRQV